MVSGNCISWSPWEESDGSTLRQPDPMRIHSLTGRQHSRLGKKSQHSSTTTLPRQCEHINTNCERATSGSVVVVPVLEAKSRGHRTNTRRYEDSALKTVFRRQRHWSATVVSLFLGVRGVGQTDASRAPVLQVISKIPPDTLGSRFWIDFGPFQSNL